MGSGCAAASAAGIGPEGVGGPAVTAPPVGASRRRPTSRLIPIAAVERRVRAGWWVFVESPGPGWDGVPGNEPPVDPGREKTVVPESSPTGPGPRPDRPEGRSMWSPGGNQVRQRFYTMPKVE